MKYWLVKSEPDVYSWEQFVTDKRTCWDGVRNYQARNNLNGMSKGDPVLFYHSNAELAVVGIAVVAKTAYQDPTTAEVAWVSVDLKPVRRLKKPVPLAVIKSTPALANIALVRQGRLSVMELTQVEFEKIEELGAKA